MPTWFANPWAFWLLVLLPILGTAGAWAWWRRRRDWARLGYPPTLSRSMVMPGGSRVMYVVGGAAALILLVIGVAGPRWGRDWEQTAPGRDWVILLDVSRTMQADDVPPSRLRRARAWLIELSRTADLRGDRLALVVFAGRPLVVCPLTHDGDFFRETLANLDATLARPELRPTRDMPSGTRIGAGLREAVHAHELSFQGFQDILLVSDGDDPADDQEWQMGVPEAQARQIPVHVVGIGDPQNGGRIPVEKGYLSEQGQEVRSFLEESKLRTIAERTSGTYTAAKTQVLPVAAWVRSKLAPRPASDPGEGDERLPGYRLRYAWFFGGGLLVLTLPMAWLPFRGKRALRKGAKALRSRVGAVLVFIALVLVAAAAKDDPEMCLREGNAAYERGEHAAALDWYARAEIRTTDPGLVAFNKAATLYRLGDYDQAAQHYRRSLEDAEGTRRTQAFFNLGNALLHGSRGRDLTALTGAIRAYESCLGQADLEPDLREDVVYNQDLARSLWRHAKTPAKAPGDGGSSNPESRDPFGGRQGSDGMFGPEDAQPDGVGPIEKESPTGQETRMTDRAPPPGAGNLPSLADSSELVSLTADQAGEHLRAAVGRIRTEQQQRVRAQLSAPRRSLDR